MSAKGARSSQQVTMDGDVIYAQHLLYGLLDALVGRFIGTACSVEDDLCGVLDEEIGALKELGQQLLGEHLLNGLFALVVGVDALCLYAL